LQREEKTVCDKISVLTILHNWLSPYLHIINIIWRQEKDVPENAAFSAKIQAIRNRNKKKIKIEEFSAIWPKVSDCVNHHIFLAKKYFYGCQGTSAVFHTQKY